MVEAFLSRERGNEEKKERYEHLKNVKMDVNDFKYCIHLICKS